MPEYRKSALVFAGQGSHMPDNMRSTLLIDGEATAVLEETTRIAREYGIIDNFTERLRDGDAAALGANSAINQMIIGAHGIQLRSQLMEKLPELPITMMGFSVGELMAYNAAGVFSDSDTLKLLAVRGKGFNEACEQNSGIMRAVLGLSREQIEEILKDFEGVTITNHNNPSQILIGGEVDKVLLACEALKTAGARTVDPKTAGAFHTPLMSPAQVPFAQALNEVQINPFQSFVIANREGGPARDVKQSLIEQIVNPVEAVKCARWLTKLGTQIVFAMDAKGIAGNNMRANLEGTGIEVVDIKTPADVEAISVKDLEVKKSVQVIKREVGETRARIFVVASSMLSSLGDKTQTFEAMLRGDSGVRKLTTRDVAIFEEKDRWTLSKEKVRELVCEDLLSVFFTEVEWDDRDEKQQKLLEGQDIVTFRIGIEDTDFEQISDETTRKTIKKLFQEFKAQDREADFHHNYPTKIGAIIPDEIIDEIKAQCPKDIRDMTHAIWYAYIMAKKNFEAAGMLKDDGTLLDEFQDMAAIIGTGLGGQIINERGSIKGAFKGVKIGHGPSTFFPGALPNMLAAWIARKFKIRGLSETPNTACATGLSALFAAVQFMRSGSIDIAIVGGADEAIRSANGLKGFALMKALSRRNNEPEKASAPYTIEHGGFVMGDAGGELVLMEKSKLETTSIKPLCELVGVGGSTCVDGKTITEGTPEGQARAYLMAIEDAGITPEDIDLVISHGTSTPVGDPIESKSLNIAFEGKVPPVFSLKGHIGHALGGAGAQNAVIATEIFRSNLIPAVRNYSKDIADPNCNIPVVDQVTEFKRRNGEGKGQYIMTSAYGFGGPNYVAIFKRCDDGTLEEIARKQVENAA